MRDEPDLARNRAKGASGPWTKPLARQLRVLLLFYLLI